jgi:hypothetical protein
MGSKRMSRECHEHFFQPETSSQSGQIGKASLTIEQLATVFILFACMSCIAFSTLCLEICYENLKNVRKSPENHKETLESLSLDTEMIFQIGFTITVNSRLHYEIVKRQLEALQSEYDVSSVPNYVSAHNQDESLIY